MNVAFTNRYSIGANIKDPNGETVFRIPARAYQNLFLVLEVHPDSNELLVISRPYKDGKPAGPWQTEGTFENATVEPDRHCSICGWTFCTCNCNG